MGAPGHGREEEKSEKLSLSRSLALLLYFPVPFTFLHAQSHQTMSATAADDQAALRKAIVAIMLDSSLTEAEKALRRQALMSGKWAPDGAFSDEKKGREKGNAGAVRR